MASPAPAATLPATIGRFQPRRVLGRGGQGVVYLAHDPELGREVALKTLTSRGRDPLKLLAEARNVARLDHAGIVSLFEIALDHAPPYLVYQFAAGKPLAAWIGGERLPARQALEAMLKVLDAMHYAHGQGVLHRDLTPANILLDEAGQARILDFGIAVSVQEVAERPDIAGTPNYLAPEVLANQPPTPGSDIFALGVVLWELLTGQRLFAADNPMAVIYKVINDRIQPPSLVANGLDPALDAVVMKALEKDPARRYPGAAAMRDAIRAYLAPAEDSAEPTPAGGGKHSGAIDFLKRRMARRPDFPAISQHIAEINQKSGRHDSIHLNDLAGVILKDYALTTKLLKVVNSAVYAQYGGSISTVSRAVVILGFEQVRALALGLIIFEHLQNGQQAEALKDASCSSFLSGMLAKEICAAERRAGVGEDVFIAAMFHKLGRHLAIYYFPEEFREVQALMQSRGLEEAAAAREIFGADFAEFGMAIGRDWNLPDRLLNAMRPQRAGKLRAGRDADEVIAQMSAFSNEVAEITGGDPRGMDGRLDALLERYKDCVGLTAPNLKSAVSSAIDATRTYAKILKVDLDATPYLKRVEKAVRDGGAAAAEGGADTGGAPAPGVRPDPMMETGSFQVDTPEASQRRHLFLTNAISELTTAILERAPVNDMFTMVLEALYRAMGFSHVLFLMRDPKRRAYLPRFGFGDDVEALKERFVYDMAPGNDIFAQAVTKGRNAVIIDTADERYRDTIPAWVTGLTQPRSILVFAVVVNKVCIGLIYADSCAEQLRMNATELKLLNTLVKQLTLGVVQR